MKKLFYLPCALFAIVTLNSCSKCYDCSTEECITISTITVCESDFISVSGMTWESYKASVILQGGTVVNSVNSEICDEDDKAAAVASGSTCTEN